MPLVKNTVSSHCLALHSGCARHLVRVRSANIVCMEDK